jgi:hypothetical protein
VSLTIGLVPVVFLAAVFLVVAFLAGCFTAAELTPTVFVTAAESDDPPKESALTSTSANEQKLTSRGFLRFANGSFIHASRKREIERVGNHLSAY